MSKPKEITVALSAWRTMERGVLEQAAEIKRLKGETSGAAAWHAIDDETPRDRVFLAWDGAMRFLCGWVAEDGWCVMNSDALEDIADDGEGRNRTADPILWMDIPKEPMG